MFDDHRGLSPADQWYRHQSCVAGAAGNGLSGSCAEGHAELQFPEPVPGMSGLWAGWFWCGANGRGEGQDQLGDSPGSRCQSHQLMIATNIVDKVQVPSAIVPGAYLLSWRWDVSILCAVVELSSAGNCLAISHFAIKVVYKP